MKSKIFTLTFMLIALISFNINAQPLNWQEDSPSDWEPITMAPDFENFTEGTASLKITFTETGTPYFVSDEFDVTASTAFTLTMDILDNDPACDVNLRVRFILDDESTVDSTSTEYTSDNANFQTYTYSASAPANAVKAYIIVRMYDDSDNWNGSGTFNLDNALFTQGGANLLANPGFEDWTTPTAGSTADFWWEDSPSDWTPLTLEADATNKTHGFFSAKITFTETGTPYFVSDEFEVTASAAFNLSMDILDNDPACDVNLRVRFILNDESTVDSTSTEYTSDNATFQTYTYSASAPANAVKAYIIVRMYDDSDNWDGSGTFNLDNASFTQGGDNLIANPSFEMWTKEIPSEEKEILSFNFEALDPVVYGEIDQTAHTISLSVPTGTDLTSLVPTITISAKATVSPASGAAQDFTNPVTYTVTAEDETTQDYTVTVTETDEVVIFQEYFENVPRVIPDGWTLIENDGYTPNEGDERWADSAWVVTTTGRPEFAGTHVAMALSYYSDMPLETGRTNDWMITPAISLGSNSTLSWKAMSTTSSGDYPDDYRVIIAPASESVDPTESYFETYGEILLEVAPESWSAAVGNPGEGISERSIALKDAGNGDGYADVDVWIAFVCITGEGGGSNLAIDDIKVVEGAATGVFNPIAQELNVNVYPNPTSGAFKIGVKSDVQSIAQIEIYDLVGRVVFAKNADVTVGQNYIDLSASEFETGIYLVNTKINNKMNVTKLIVK